MSDSYFNEPKVLKYLTKVETFLITVSLLLMIIIIFLQVFFRYVIHYSLPWSEELSRYLMTCVVFVGASIGAKEGVHIGVEAFVNLLPPVGKKIAVALSGICSIFFGLAITYVGFLAVRHIGQMGQISPAMEIPMWIAYSPICFGSFFMAIRFGQAMINELRVTQKQEA